MAKPRSVSLIYFIPQIKVASFIEAQFDWYELRLGYTQAALVEIKYHGEKRVGAGGGRSVGPV